MKKITAIFFMVMFVVVAMIGAPQTAISAPKTIKIAVGSPEGSVEYHMAMAFKGVIENIHRGDINVEIYPGEIMGTILETMDGLVAGTIQMVVDEANLFAKFYAPVKFFSMPFSINSSDQITRLVKSQLWKDFNDNMAKKCGLRYVGMNYRGSRLITATDKIIKTPDDMKGMKIRTPELREMLVIYQALGAKPTPIAYSELYLALKMGVCEGQENPPANIANMKFYEVQKYLVDTGPIPSVNGMVMNDKFLNSLSPQIKADVLRAGEIAGEYGRLLDSELDSAERRFLTGKGKMILVEADTQAFKEKTKDVYKKFLGGLFTEELYQKMKTATGQ